MRIVIIGHTGFIGNNIYRNLINNKEYEILGVSTNEIDLTEDKSHNALSKFLSSPCIVIMCAGIKKQLGDNMESYEKNIFLISNFCKAISSLAINRIIFFSSASVYGEDVKYSKKISEKTPVNPKSYYGIAKYNAEQLLTKVCADNDIDLIILRPPLIYGKDDLSRGYGPTGFIYKALNREEIILWGKGDEFREFIYIDDVARIVKTLVNSRIAGVVNLVSGKSYTFKEIIDSINNVIGQTTKVVTCERTKNKVDHHYSNELIKKILPSFKFTSLNDGLIKTYSSINKKK